MSGNQQGKAIALTRAAVVAITTEGVRLPSVGGHVDRPLDRRELEALLDLAAGPVGSNGDGPAPAPPDLVDRLLERGFAEVWAFGDVPSAIELVDPFAWPDVPPVEGQLVTRVPVLLRPAASGFELLDHDGEVAARLDVDAVLVAAAFREPATVDEARARLAADPDTASLPADRIDRALTLLLGSGLVAPFDLESSTQGREQRTNQSVRDVMIRFNREMRAALAEHDAEEAARMAGGARPRTRVLPVLSQPGMTPLALGMLFATATAHRGGALLGHYDLRPHWWMLPQDVDAYAPDPSIYLFSDYVWSVRDHLRLGERAKAANPANITIHGGPDAPRNPGDAELFFARNPSVDVVVHGEGEITTAELLDALATARHPDGSFDLGVLADVPGLSFRHEGRVVRTADRERVADLDQLPSPYLTGVFDGPFTDGRTTAAIIETNRGCPYGCTFCDWGSATQSRIRKFDLERVFGELEWCARNQVPTVVLADANFGIFERDVAIAQRFAELKQEYGFPYNFGTNYAKNTVKHLKHIVQILVEADVLTEGLLSLQTMDEGTLSTVKRSNIKTEKYDLLANEFRKAGLPLFVDLMVGLPGSTTSSFRDDIQQCIDREVTPKIFQTEVLVNSPMNQPEYREEHQIVTGFASGEHLSSKVVEESTTNRRLIISTSSFTRADYDEMLELRRLFRLVDNFGVLRQVTRFARQETGRREVDIIDGLRVDAHDAERWPMLAVAFDLVPELMVPPLSWRPFIDEVGTYLVEVVGVPRDPSLDTVLTVQHALLPSPGRQFPVTLELAHDYASWHRAMIDAKDGGHRTDWPAHVPHLRDLPPATFTVDDPADVCGLGLGFSNEADWGGDWELESPVARAMPSRHRLYT